MLDFLKFWRYYRYPGQHWGRDIAQILNDMPLRPANIIDAPCGDGIISYWLLRRGVVANYELYDLSESAIAKALRLRGYHRASKLQLKIEQQNIHELPADPSEHDVWLLINSLYLLPNIDDLLARMRPRVKTIIGVFPRTDTTNYRRWKQRSPDLNVNEMGKLQTDEFFARHGYRSLEKRDFCYVPLTQLRSKYLRLAAMFLVNPVERLWPRKEANYWLGVYVRTNNGGPAE